MSKKGCVIGSINFDIILRQPRFAEIGETLTIDGVWSGGGGKGANQAVQMAKLDVDTSLIACVGNDIFSNILLAELSSYGVDISLVEKRKGSSGLGVVNSIPSGKVTASILRGSNALLTDDIIEKNLKIIKTSDILLFQLETPLETSFQAMKKSEAYVVLNAAPAAKLLPDMWERIDCVIVNEIEASFYTDMNVNSVESAVTAAKCLHDISGERATAVVTLGSLGSVVWHKDKGEYIPPCDAPCVESTGAGDSYIGAFAAHYIKHSDVMAALEFGTKCSSMTIQGIGAQSSMPTLSMLDKYDTLCSSN